MKTRKAIVSQMRSWIGLNEKDGSFKKILKIYNEHKPLARGYTVKATDNWCATTVSAAAIVTGMTDIIPLECSCQKMIDKAQKMGIWVEDDSHKPSAGDIIMYNWDSATHPNTGWADHVGIVEKVSGKSITVIEGNKSEAVGRRVVCVNAPTIRGYITPKYNKMYKSVYGSVVRDNPSFGGKIIAKVPKSEEVEYLGKSEKSKTRKWMKCSYDGKTGWISTGKNNDRLRIVR